MRRGKIVAYYTPKMVLRENIDASMSKSPLKPALVISELMRVANEHVRIQPMFSPFTKDDFRIAHTEHWVDEVFHYDRPGETMQSMIPWSEELVRTLTYTSSSLYHAIRHSIKSPDDLALSPSAGFHHSMPNAGKGYCTFSGQVVASVKLYRESGVRGCYLDLDGHYGNSIEDSRYYVSDLDKAVPEGFNFNPSDTGDAYVNELYRFLYNILLPSMLDGRIDYVVWCHGADSNISDDYGGQVNTQQWLMCSEVFWKWVTVASDSLGRPVPVSMSLFGGYREDSYDSVISLHVSDMIIGMNRVFGLDVPYTLRYVDIDKYAKLTL